MKRLLGLTIFVCCMVAASASVSAESSGIEERYDNLYDRERFDTTDVNKDGVLDKAELNDAQKDFEYYRDNELFQHADTNKDGVISFEEAKNEKQWEKKHHDRLERQALKDLKNKYP